MPISREEITWLYRCVLGREPESQQVIEHGAVSFNDFNHARTSFIGSDEFMNYVKHLIASKVEVYYVPEVSPTPPVKDAQNRLALAAIVKNEAGALAQMVESCLPIVDFVAIVDTGSTDNTEQIAGELLRRAGIEHVVKHASFVDFSQARNLALAAVPVDYQWILMLDADEHLVPEDYQKLLDLLSADTDVWALPRFNFNDSAKKLSVSPYPDFQQRLIRNRAEHPPRFSGAVHEEIRNASKMLIAPISQRHAGGAAGGPHIHHMGQVDVSPERWAEKHSFYMNLRAQQTSSGEA